MISAPSGVVTLYDLLQFYGEIFAEYLPWLSVMEYRFDTEEKRTNAVVPVIAATVFAKVGVLRGLVEMYGLTSIKSQCVRTTSYLQSHNMVVECGALRDHLHELRNRIEDEFRGQLLLHLEPKQAKGYSEPLNDWGEVISRFPKTRFNIEECSKCFALERYGASVFHATLVAEYGVIQIADLMGVSGDKPGWGSLGRLNDILKKKHSDRSAEEQKHSRFLEATLPLTTVIKDSWRHKMDHVDKQIIWVDTDFSPNVADEIIKATRGFMRKLANELPQ
jgi:hypothetical protein